MKRQSRSVVGKAFMRSDATEFEDFSLKSFAAMQIVLRVAGK